MLITNCKLRNRKELVDIEIEQKIIKSITKSNNKIGDLDLEGKILMEPFIEPHIHLDTALTAGEPHHNMSGTLFEGIEIWSKRKEKLTIADVKERAIKAIELQISNGIGFVRTHVDITDPNLTALKALIELREELKDVIVIQIVAFPQEGIISYHQGKELLRKAAEMGVDCIGAIPHFEYQRDWGVESVYFALDLAKEFSLLVDIHCDEIDDEQSRFLEVVAAYAWQIELYDKVTVSHTTAFGSYNPAYSYKLMRALKASKINFIANPLVNMNLGGRFDNTKMRRGLTQIKNLLNNKINVCFGHDDIYDPWYPLGNGDMLEVLQMGLHAAHLLSYEEIAKSLDLISLNSARTLKLENYEVKVGNPATFIILDGKSDYEVVRFKKEVVAYYKDGEKIMEKKPSEIIKLNLERTNIKKR